MIDSIIFISFIVLLLLSLVHLCKILHKDFRKDDRSVSVQIRSIGQPTIEPDCQTDQQIPNNQDFEYNDFDNRPESKAKSSSISFSSIGKLVFLLLIVGLGYSFKDNLHTVFASIITKTHVQKKRASLISQDSSTHKNVGGVNWHKIIATDSKGLQICGWVSEFSIKEAPPKPSKILGMVDNIRKDIGLPTTEEQVQSIKNFRNVSKSLKSTMKVLRKRSKSKAL